MAAGKNVFTLLSPTVLIPHPYSNNLPEPVHEITVAACPSAAVAPPSRSGSAEAEETERARAFAAVQRLAGMVPRACTLGRATNAPSC
jgi:hypothetical protein